MNASMQIICSLSLTLGVPMVIAGWELWRIDPTTRRLPPDDDSPVEPAPLSDTGVSPRIHKPLPSCLVPVIRQAVPERVRELV